MLKAVSSPLPTIDLLEWCNQSVSTCIAQHYQHSNEQTMLLDVEEARPKHDPMANLDVEFGKSDSFMTLDSDRSVLGESSLQNLIRIEVQSTERAKTQVWNC